MKGSGRTVFSGTRVEEFQAEILGVLENVGPRQSIILARLHGGPLEQTGVMQGMSGSPVYIDGKLIGAVALSFPFAKEPIAGIRPIEEMLRLGAERPAQRAALPQSGVADLASLLPRREEVDSQGQRLQEIATPLWLSGFTRKTLEAFAPSLRLAGLEPAQGIGGGGKPVAATTGKPTLEPGAMISVQLMTGDLSVGADGTVTHIDGNRVYAFGHRFLSVGETELPFARAEVITLLANQQVSFKISSPREWLGAMLQDRSTTLAGELGRTARLTPVRLRVTSHPSGESTSYEMAMVGDRLFAPLLLQMAVYSAIDATERSVGASTTTVRGALELADARSIRIDNVYSGDLGVPQQTSAGSAAPLAVILQSGYDALQVKSINLELDVWDRKRQWQIESLVPGQKEVRPGDTVDLAVLFTGDDGAESSTTLRYPVPIGAAAGPLFFTVADAFTTNITEYRQFLTTPPRNAGQMIGYLNGLRSNDKAYLRVWRSYPSYQVQGETLPDPPPSLALLLGRTAQSASSSRVAEIAVNLQMPGGGMVSGSKTVQVEVKE
jgi:hypothetical protein